MLFDALGNEIVCGKWYGYSRCDGGGRARVIVGKIKSIKPDAIRVSLHDAIEKNYNGSSAEFEHRKRGPSVSPKTLFPVADDDMVFMLLKTDFK